MDNNREQNGIDSVPDYVKRYLKPNDPYSLENSFIEDSFGQVVTKSFSFQNLSTNEN